MVAISALVSAFLTVAAVQATSVTKLLVDIATAGQGAASCLSRVSFDDAPDVDVLGCILDSNGRSVNTALGQVTVKCDVNAGPLGPSQCLDQRVVCRAGWCATLQLVPAST